MARAYASRAGKAGTTTYASRTHGNQSQSLPWPHCTGSCSHCSPGASGTQRVVAAHVSALHRAMFVRNQVLPHAAAAAAAAAPNAAYNQGTLSAESTP